MTQVMDMREEVSMTISKDEVLNITKELKGVNDKISAIETTTVRMEEQMKQFITWRRFIFCFLGFCAFLLSIAGFILNLGYQVHQAHISETHKDALTLENLSQMREILKEP